jgi:thiol-disulfide isomerase/thioredoxin
MKNIPFTLLVLPFLLVGCDSDGDGLSNADEKALGTDPNVADTDADGLTDLEESNGVTDPLIADSDEDGLNDGDELLAGTDPLLGDSDGDGFSDAAEVGAGSDPLLQFSWPLGEAQWPDFSSESIATSELGWDYEQTMPDFELTDQFGNVINLHQFFGYTILLDFSAGWCGPCKSVASTANELWLDYDQDGFLIIHVLLDGWHFNDGVDQTFLNEWADEYGIDFPITYDTSRYALNNLAGTGLYEGGIPFMVLLDKDLRIDSTYAGSSSESAIATRVEELLGLTAE